MSFRTSDPNVCDRYNVWPRTAGGLVLFVGSGLALGMAKGVPKIWEGALGRISCELIRNLLAVIEDEPSYRPKKGIFNDTPGMKKDTLYTDMDLLADFPPVENSP